MRSELTLRIEPNTVVAPREAIQIGQSGNYVFTIVDGDAHVQPVEVGRTQDGETVVVKGLNGGERVVVDGALLLVEGSKVEIRNPPKGSELMSLPELCIRRPVMTSLLMLSFIVFGLFGYRQIAGRGAAARRFSDHSVSATLPGASPDTMASSVAGPLERAFATIPGITMMTSSSALGTTNIVMQFDLDRNIDGAALDVQSNISATLRKLPPQLPAPPSFQKVNPADSPILFIALVSKTLPLTEVDDYAEQVFAEQISQLTGVAQVLVFGQQKFAVRVPVDPDAAAARGLTLGRRQQRGRRGEFLDAGRRLARQAPERHRRRDRADGARRRIRRSRRRLAQRLAGQDEGNRATSTIPSRTSRSPPGTARPRDRAGDLRAVRRQYRRHRRQRQIRAFPITSRNCRRRCRRWCSPIARCRSASRSRTCR